ncbi:MAG: FtsX-like permease family protein [Candidatus Viridilinea halotolerans]|uniref:FtsX-like permease family protein n=1 Tax=Candidatus Viridilinea halotolerans TaxID=2491704 RepID=A0A426U6N5_9CHLR|nr:MAG: FtsX-like permease family protein [Candidatus Viridilinea halotolerans]
MMLSLKNLLRRKMRTLLTILGVAVGVAAVVVLSAFGEGMARGFSVNVTGNADLLVSQKDAVMIMIGAIDESVGDEIARIRGVARVDGTVIGIEATPDSPYFLVAGEDPRGFSLARYQVVAGRPISARRQVMLGARAAENLRKNVGDKFRINALSYTIVGIYETGASFEDNGAVIHIADAQRSFDRRRQVNYFKVQLHDPRERDAVRAEIEARWSALAVTRSGDPSSQDEMLEVYSSMGWFLGVFAMLVGGLGMMNAQLMSVFERTREIGVLRALGWRRRRIVGMIVGEALILSAVGGILGLLLSMGLVALLARSPALGGFLNGTVEPSALSQALIIAGVLGLIGGGYPAWRAARLAPVEAMRSESGATVHWGWTARLFAPFMRGPALRNLLRRPARSLMAMVGLGFGVGLIVALGGIANGASNLFTEMLSAGQADILAQQAGVSDAMFSSVDERIADRIRTHPEVKAVSRLIFGVTNVPGLPFFMVYGLDPREGYIASYRTTEGRSIQRNNEMIIGRLAATSLNKGVGDTLRFSGQTFTIAGIYETGVSYQDTGAVINIREAQRLFGKPRQVSFLGISLHNPERATEVAAEIERRYPDLLVAPTNELTSRMADFATMDAIFDALMALMMLIGGIVMMNVMLMSVFERTQEIGVLRAVGWSSGRVLRMILTEAFALSLLSALAGILIGIGLNVLFQLTPDYGEFLTPSYALSDMSRVLIMAIGLGIVGGILPAWRAVRLSPLEALHSQ